MGKAYTGMGGIELPNEDYPARIANGYYRVMEEADGDSAEIGAYKLLANAIKACDAAPGSCVVADAGVRIYPQEDSAENPGGSGETGKSGETGESGEGGEGGAGESGGTASETGGSGESDGSGESGTGGSGETGSVETGGSGETGESGGTEVSGGSDDPASPTTPTTPTTPGTRILYGRLKSLMNIREQPSMDSETATTYAADTVVDVLEVQEDGWLKIVCPEAVDGMAYVFSGGGEFVATSTRIYVTKPKDTLAVIAEEQLGDASRYTEIQELNGISVNVVNIGVTLLLPE